ncbi:hypothetical protein F4780DRAFT_340046 [Xylariomycetidae sp. FL0641]|nr:hypothetical protein F4780DRAFT_340046 [Xylariomycetidae sp. FL0641]
MANSHSLEGKKPTRIRQPMRSSIACTRCRRSKIKCENTGPNSICDSCIKTGKQCVFKVPDPVPPKRSEPPAATKQDRDGGPDRKKLKKIDDISKVDSQRATVYAEEALAAPFLTEDLWEQLLDLYKLHFAPELPFLHLPTMKEKLSRKFSAPQSDSDSEANLVLLGVLTLTARFHPDLVKYLAHICNNQPGNARTRPIQTHLEPAAASEYYADVLAMALGPLRTAMGVASMERVAALLMLGLYEWSQAQPKTGGMTAWMYVGNAIRMAQFLGLGFGDGREDTRDEDPNLPRTLMPLQKEVKRRVMFSCFILDRMLACGKQRVSIIRTDELQIQLPCSEDRFDLAMEVPTAFLGQPGKNTDDSVLSRFIQLVDIWGEISKYSSRGGRLMEEFPPWDQRTSFAKLSRILEVFDDDLPPTFTFSKVNYIAHENHQASSAYVMLHMLRFLSLIMLHREYVPFVPIRCKEPEGPLDPPKFPEDEFEVPEGFWRASAEQLFRAARGIVELIEICQRKDKLPQSTIVLFAIWTASFVGLYGFHFPQMDTERHMLSFDYEAPRQGDVQTDVFMHGPTALTFRTLHRMSAWLKMATTYVRILKDMDEYFVRIKQDYHRYAELNAQEGGTTLRVREGGTGAGLEEYKNLTMLKDLGPHRPDRHDHMDISERSQMGTPNQAGKAKDGSSSSSSVNHGSRSAPPGSFTAINHAPTMPAPDTTRLLGPSLRGLQGEMYADSWRYPNGGIGTQPDPRSPPQPYPTPGSMLDASVVGAQTQAHGLPGLPGQAGEEIDNFALKFHKEETRRFGTTGDLGYFSTGQPQVSLDNIAFADSSYLPVIEESGFGGLMHHAGGFLDSNAHAHLSMTDRLRTEEEQDEEARRRM